MGELAFSLQGACFTGRPFSALADPAAQQGDLIGGQSLTDWWHGFE